MANWQEISQHDFERLQALGEHHFVSESGSVYFELNHTIYRRSDHWHAAVADCAWFLDGRTISRLCYAKNPLSGFKEKTIEQALGLNLSETSLRTFTQRLTDTAQSGMSASTSLANSTSDSCQPR